MLSEKIWNALLDFFSPVPHKYRKDEWFITNLATHYDKIPHVDKTVIEFLLKLHNSMWNWEKWNDDESEMRFAQKIEEARPWMTKILVALGRWDILEATISKLSKPCLEELRAIALSATMDDAKVRTLEEAVYAGSKAAQLLLIHRTKTEVDRQLRKLQAAKAAQKKAQERVKEAQKK